MKIAPMLAELIALEQQVKTTIAAADAALEPRVYEWRPSKYPELPAIWNWIDDGSYDIDDTARATDSIVITVTLGVRPSELAESIGKLVALTDYALEVIDPALARRPLNGTARTAKRLKLATRIDDFSPTGQDAPVMCMDLPIEVQLSRIINPA